MKKLVMMTITLLSYGMVHALPVGNPIEASLFSDGVFFNSANCDPCNISFCWCDALNFRLGFYGDYVFNRHLEVDAVNNDKDINVTNIFTNAGYIAFNLFNRAEAFATIGTTRFSLMANSKAWGNRTSQDELGVLNRVEFLTEFSWSVGGRATLLNWRCLGVGIEGQYFQTKPELSFLTHVLVPFQPGQILYFNDNSTRYREWQVGLGASYRFTTNCPTYALIPYIAAKWAKSKFHIDVPLAGTDLFINSLESKKHWGYAVGMSLTICDAIGATVEGRFADEKAIYVNGELRF